MSIYDKLFILLVGIPAALWSVCVVVDVYLDDYTIRKMAKLAEEGKLFCEPTKEAKPRARTRD